MAEQCRGITTRGGRCQLTVRGSAYCRYHHGQGENPPQCQGEEEGQERISPRTTIQRRNIPPAPIRRNVVPAQQPTITPRRVTGRQLRFSPIAETAFQASPDIRQLTEEQEFLTEVPIFEEDEEGQPVNLGLFEGEDFPEEEEIGLDEEEEDDFSYLEELLSVPLEDYLEASYDELYRLLEIFGFTPEYLPPRNPPRREIEVERGILLSLLDQYISGTISEDVLTEVGILNYRHAQEFLYGQASEEEEEEFIEEEWHLEEVFDIPQGEYVNYSYKDLFGILVFLGFNTLLLPAQDSQKAEDKEILIQLLEDYTQGRLDVDFLTEEGIEKLRQGEELNLIVEEEEEEPHQHPHREDIKGEACCICMDEEVPGGELLACQHPVCVPCLRQLTKDECPMCRAKLAGPTVTPDILQRTELGKEQDRIAAMNADLLVALALAENPNADVTELYDRFYQAR